jgi:hypothetical protein
MPSDISTGSAPASAEVRAVIAALMLGSILMAGAADAADEAPDAQLLLELLRFLDSRASDRRPPADETHH